MFSVAVYTQPCIRGLRKSALKYILRQSETMKGSKISTTIKTPEASLLA